MISGRLRHGCKILVLSACISQLQPITSREYHLNLIKRARTWALPYALYCTMRSVYTKKLNMNLRNTRRLSFTFKASSWESSIPALDESIWKERNCSRVCKILPGIRRQNGKLTSITYYNAEEWSSYDFFQIVSHCFVSIEVPHKDLLSTKSILCSAFSLVKKLVD